MVRDQQSYGNLQRTPNQTQSESGDYDADHQLNRAIDSAQYEDMDDDGTPIESPSKSKKFALNEPRTPTPFKNALNEFRKRRGEK